MGILESSCCGVMSFFCKVKVYKKGLRILFVFFGVGIIFIYLLCIVFVLMILFMYVSILLVLIFSIRVVRL